MTPGPDPIAETQTETHIVGRLQIRGYSVTQERETVAKILERKGPAWDIKGLQKITQLPQKSLRRILQLFREERLIHHSPSQDLYFACQKPFQVRPDSCHSFGVCEVCHAVREFIHSGHAHPKIPGLKVLSREHEWVGRCPHHP